MNFFNKINDFLFPKEKPTQFSLTDNEALNLVSELLTNYRHEYVVGYLVGHYLSGCDKDETEHKIKTLQATLAKFQEEEISLLENNGNQI